jgi:hypothetical protein
MHGLLFDAVLGTAVNANQSPPTEDVDDYAAPTRNVGLRKRTRMGRLETLDGRVLTALRAGVAKTEKHMSASRNTEGGKV